MLGRYLDQIQCPLNGASPLYAPLVKIEAPDITKRL